MKKIWIPFIFLLVVATISKAQGNLATPVYKYYHNVGAKHFNTTNFDELGTGKNGYVYEGTSWKLNAPLSNPNTTGYDNRNIYRFYNPQTGAHYYSINLSAPNGFQYENIMGSVYGMNVYQSSVFVTIYQFHNSSGDYYYAPSSIAPSGYIGDGIAYYAFAN